MSTALRTETPTAPRWHDFEGRERLVARDVVRSLTLLLRDVLHWTGGAGADDLLDNLRATLATDGPESALPLDAVSGAVAARREVGAQVATISEHLVGWVVAELAGGAGEHGQPAPTRSRCDGHPWTPAVQRLLMGTRGGPEAMQGFNEFLHQVVLLRDALVPFTNWQEVPVLVGAGDGTGLRHLDGAREAFSVELMVRQVRATAVVDLARRAVEGRSGPQGYGFTSPHGTVLPAVVGADPLEASSRLLTWHAPGALALPRPDGTTTAVPALGDYYAAARTPAAELASPSGAAVDQAGSTAEGGSFALVPTPAAEPGTCTVGLRPAAGAAVDLGQAVRGHRYAYRAAAGDRTAGDEGVQVLDARAVLAAPGLVWAPAGTWAVSAGHDPAIVLALLGKLYPENVVLVPGGGWAALDGVGKDGTATFLVLDAARA